MIIRAANVYGWYIFGDDKIVVRVFASQGWHEIEVHTTDIFAVAQSIEAVARRRHCGFDRVGF